jgi:hypothetical protein
MPKITVSGPKDQIETYQKEANEMDVTYAEYGRMMIQAGRRELGYESPRREDKELLNDILVQMVREELTENEGLDVEVIISRIQDEVSEEIKQVLDDLQESGQIEFSAKKEGYVFER